MDDLISQYVAKVRKRSKDWPLHIRMLHLQEEVGELTDIYLQNNGWKDKPQTKTDFIIAMNDVMAELLMIYDEVGTNPIKEIQQQLDELQ